MRRDPYIVGRPVTEKELFFGRQYLFDFLRDHLEKNAKVLLLHGQRRIGKSSLLRQIPNFVTEGAFIFVFFDLQDKGRLPLGNLLHDLARTIVESLELEDQIDPPTIHEITANREIFTRQFLPKIYQQIGSKNLVLLLDEFDVVNDENPALAENNFFPYLLSLLKTESKLFIIPVIGRKPEDLRNLLELFKGAPHREIDLLDDTAAWQLIKVIAGEELHYEDDAIRAILKQSAGHPYFTQAICSALFNQAREQDKWEVTRADVGEELLNQAIELAHGGLVWFWDGLRNIPEKVVFSAVAAAQTQPNINRMNALTLLTKYGVILTDELEQALKRLIEIKYVDQTGSRVRVELVQRWLVTHHPLSEEIRTLENLNPDAQTLYRLAENRTQANEKQQFFESALRINPNHFESLFKLAEIYLNRQIFREATELYARAYQVNAVRNQEGFLQSLLGYGNVLFRDGDFTSAKAQFGKVLEIDADKSQAKERLLEIEAIDKNPQRKRSLTVALLLMAFVGAPILIGFGYWLGKPCPLGQTKLLLGCAATATTELPWLSYGERSVFPDGSVSHDSYFKEGTEAFKNHNFSQAAELFQQALKNKPNDPEALIYKNNALAANKGSAFTLAVVVPASGTSQSSALEMLRGVAQAQDEFNNKGGMNGRLLQIVIANDGNDPTQSPTVAQTLASNLSVLGVIGHNSSEASKVALGKYEDAKVAMISPTSSSTDIFHGNVFYRTTLSDRYIGQVLAKYVREKLQLVQSVVFYSGTGTYGPSLKESFSNSFTVLQGKIVGTVNLSDPNLNPKQSITDSLENWQAETGLLFPSTVDTDNAIKIARANYDWANKFDKPGLQLLGGTSFYKPSTLADGGEAVEGMILVVPWAIDDPGAKAFADRASALWKADVNWRTASSFDATQAFIAAIQSAKDVPPDQLRSAVLQQLPKVKVPPNLTSSNRPLSFDQDGEIESKPILVEVKDGRFRLIQP